MGMFTRLRGLLSKGQKTQADERSIDAQIKQLQKEKEDIQKESNALDVELGKKLDANEEKFLGRVNRFKADVANINRRYGRPQDVLTKLYTPLATLRTGTSNLESFELRHMPYIIDHFKEMYGRITPQVKTKGSRLEIKDSKKEVQDFIKTFESLNEELRLLDEIETGEIEASIRKVERHLKLLRTSSRAYVKKFREFERFVEKDVGASMIDHYNNLRRRSKKLQAEGIRVDTIMQTRGVRERLQGPRPLMR